MLLRRLARQEIYKATCQPRCENSPHKPIQFYDGLLVGNNIQRVELVVDNLQLVILLQGGAVGGHQTSCLDGGESSWVQDVRGENRDGVGVAQSRRRSSV